MNRLYITKAYFKTKKAHSNRDNEYKLINVAVSSLDYIPRVEIVLDSEFLGSVPYSDMSKVEINHQTNKVNITFGIDRPENLDNCPFKYTMKMYQLFGKVFKINQGNKEK